MSIPKITALFGNPIDIGRADATSPVAGNIPEPKVVNVDDDDIGGIGDSDRVQQKRGNEGDPAKHGWAFSEQEDIRS